MRNLNHYLNYIQEGYILSNKNISVNLKDFETGKKNKLLIVGTMGSGKTTLAEKLAKKYRVKFYCIDSLWHKLKQKYMQGADMSLQKNKDRVQDLFEEHVFKAFSISFSL
jgi:ATP-dependent protease Clp ATPase subunit